MESRLYEYDIGTLSEYSYLDDFSFRLWLTVGTNILEEAYFYIQGTLMKNLKKGYKGPEEDVKKIVEHLRNVARMTSDFCDKIEKCSNVLDLANMVFPINSLKIRFFIKNIREKRVECFSQPIPQVGVQPGQPEVDGAICDGCRNDSLGQTPHMECPDGCLHISKDCPVCMLIGISNGGTEKKNRVERGISQSS